MNDVLSKYRSAQDAVIREGVTALNLLVAYIDELWTHRPEPPVKGYVLVSHAAIPTALFQIGINFGVASTILFDNGPRRTSENQSLYRLRMDRVSWIRERGQNLDFSCFANRKIRNRLVHIDEYLGKAHLASDGSFVTDLAFSDRRCLQGPNGFTYCRVYEFDSDTLLHLGEEMNVSALRETASAVLARISPDEPAR